jgi:predicted transcriptional regulator
MLAGLGQSDENEFPVVTEDQLFVGTIRVADIGQIALEHRDLSSLLVAADVAIPTETAKVSDTLYDAMRRMGVRGTTMLPVIDSDNRLIGIVTRAQILTRYERALLSDQA